MKNEKLKDQEPQTMDNERVRPIEFVSGDNILQGKLFFPEHREVH